MVVSEILKKTYNHKFFLILIINSILFVGAAWFLPIRFETNDDIIMLLFASGKYTGTPESHLVFINFIYGFFLSVLYNLTTKIEWYTLIFVIIHVLSLSVIIWTIINKKIKLIYKLFFIVLYLVIEIRLILLLQFTTTAALGSLAGIALVLKKKHYQKILGLALLLLSSFIRLDATLLVMLVVSPVFIPFIFKNNKFYFNKTMIFLFIAIISMSFCKCIDYWYNHNSLNWSNYTDFCKLRGQINDNPNADKIIDNLPSGVSKTDYQLVLSFFLDPKIIDIEKIRLISQNIRRVEYEQKLNNIYFSFKAYSLLLVMFFALWVVILIGTKNKQCKYILYSGILTFLISLIYISLDGTLKYRVFLTALLPFIYLLFYSIDNFKNYFLKYLFFLVVLCFTILISYETNRIRIRKNNFYKTVFVEQKNLLEKYLYTKRNTVLPLLGDFNIEYYPPFLVSSQFCQQKILFSGWVTGIPYDNNNYTSHLDLVDRIAIFLNKKNIKTILPFIIDGIEKNYNLAVDIRVEEKSKNYIIIKLARK